MRPRTLLPIAACVALGACGGGESDEDAVRETLRTYLGAVAEGDGDKACDLLTGEAKRQALDAFATDLPELAPTSCGDGLTKLAESLGEDEKQLLRDPGEIEVDVTGETATATLEAATQEAELTKSGDTWLISGGLF